VTDADPEHEVGDTPSPTYRDIISPDADAGEEQIKNTECAKAVKDPVIAMATHHHSGALFSTMPAIRSEIHAIERLFKTSGRLGIRSAIGIVSGSVSDTKHYPGRVL
jgi:hypothetical protein